MTACLLLGPPCTAHHLPGSPLAQCPGPLLLLFLLFCFISGSALPANPHPHPCLTQLLPPGPSPTTAMCPSVPIVCARRSQQQLPKQFLPTMSLTLSSITQGVPLDSSKLPTNQQLPPYPLQPPRFHSAHPATHPKASAAARVALSGLLSAALRVSAPGQAATVGDTLPSQPQ